MHKAAQQILTLFRQTGGELATSTILSHIDPNYILLKKNSKIIQNNKEKLELARQHRKILHHLNKLVTSGILVVSKHGEKGEKYFTLKLSEHEEVLELSPNYKKRIIITRPILPAMPIEGDEQRGIVKKFEPATWIDRLNSVIVFPHKITALNELHLILTEHIFPIVNDAIVIEDFEKLLPKQETQQFLQRMNTECEDYGKKLILMISINRTEESNLTNLLNYIDNNPKTNLHFIFSILNDDLTIHEEQLIKIINVFSKNRIDLYFKNKTIHTAPHFVGTAGPYSLPEKEWHVADELREKTLCIGCAQSTVIVDVANYYDQNGLNIEKFTQLLLNISKSMLAANSLQRRKSEDCFRSVNIYNKGHEAEFLSLSRNYIRFWNFGLTQPEINQEFVLNMINEAKKKINEFASAEETIYKSCGMTTRFRIALSSAFEQSLSNLSVAKYLPLEISNIYDLHKKSNIKTLRARENLAQLFDGGDEITLHYTSKPDSETILSIIKHIMHQYNFPLFNFSFESIKGDLKLSNFM